MSLNLALSAGMSGLQTAQKGLDVTSHNISNVNTVGYTRKQFSPESRVLAGFGVGVQNGGIHRTVDENLQADLRKEQGIEVRVSTFNTYYSRMQDLFGQTTDNNSISHMITDLAAEFEGLALEPDESTQQLSTVRAAEDLATKLNTIGAKLQEMRKDADQDISTAVSEVNDILSNITNLNEQITLGIATGRDVTDLQDKRDVELANLEKYMDVTSFERQGGALVVYTKGGTPLVDTESASLSHAAAASLSPWDSNGGNDVQGIYVRGADITEEIGEGQLKALVDLRDTTLSGLQSQLDELSEKVRTSLNEVHNRGTSYPTLANTYDGSRRFIDPDTQTFSLNDGDTVLTVYNDDGSEAASTTLDTIMTNAYGTGPHASRGPWTITQVTESIQGWLNSNAAGDPGLTTATAAIDPDTGQFDINLNSNSHGLAFRDQISGTTGAARDDITVGYDADGDGSQDQEVKGFSNFFGLNDLYVTGTQDWMYDSAVKSETWTANTNGVLQFYDSSNPPSGGEIGILSVQSNWTLEDIADAINTSTDLSTRFEAEIVKDGSGVRLRVKNLEGEDTVITQRGGTGLMDTLGLETSNSGNANALMVSETITNDPSRVSRGALLYNSDTSEYYVSAGDNTVANEMAESFRQNQSYEAAGGLTTGARTLADYAALVLSQNASEANEVEMELEYQSQLTSTLTLKVSEISAVNMDEELSQLLVWEQMYKASARVITTANEMLETLTNIIN